MGLLLTLRCDYLNIAIRLFLFSCAKFLWFFYTRYGKRGEKVYANKLFFFILLQRRISHPLKATASKPLPRCKKGKKNRKKKEKNKKKKKKKRKKKKKKKKKKK